MIDFVYTNNSSVTMKMVVVAVVKLLADKFVEVRMDFVFLDIYIFHLQN